MQASEQPPSWRVRIAPWIPSVLAAGYWWFNGSRSGPAERVVGAIGVAILFPMFAAILQLLASGMASWLHEVRINDVWTRWGSVSMTSGLFLVLAMWVLGGYLQDHDDRIVAECLSEPKVDSLAPTPREVLDEIRWCRNHWGEDDFPSGDY